MSETTWRFFFDDGESMDVYGGCQHESRIVALHSRQFRRKDTEIVKVEASFNCGPFKRIKNERI